MILYQGANHLQMLYSEHVLITKLWMCHMIQYLYPRIDESQIEDILAHLNARREALYEHFNRTCSIALPQETAVMTASDVLPAAHKMISCPTLYEFTATYVHSCNDVYNDVYDDSDLKFAGVHGQASWNGYYFALLDPVTLVNDCCLM